MAHIYAVFVVLIGWIFFRADTIGQAFSFIRYMFVPHSAVVLMERYMNRKLWMFLAAALLACGPVQWFWMKWKGRVLAQDCFALQNACRAPTIHLFISVFKSAVESMLACAMRT